MEWYVLRTTFTHRENTPVQFRKEEHAGPFGSRQDAQTVSDRNNAQGITSVLYSVGTKDDIGVYGIIP